MWKPSVREIRIANCRSANCARPIILRISVSSSSPVAPWRLHACCGEVDTRNLPKG
jgi:hypothetical protein